LEEGQSASLFALKQRFIEEAYQEQFDRTESRFEKKFERLKRAA
jgi:PAB1-binding protein PBP1